jgi:hypothetical protein
MLGILLSTVKFVTKNGSGYVFGDFISNTYHLVTLPDFKVMTLSTLPGLGLARAV